MRLGTVIGRVTLSQTVASLKGARWLLVSPWTREQFASELLRDSVSDQPSLVVYDNMGGGLHDPIGFVEGREAATPFPEPTPVDAINTALIDTIFYSPES